MSSGIAVLFGSLFGLIAALQPVSEKPAPEPVSDAAFWTASQNFMRNPFSKDAKSQSKTIVVFAMQSKKVAVVLSGVEIKWFGKNADKSSPLMAAYLAGNMQSQLRSGIKRNDRYAGLLHLFQMYRAIQGKDKTYKNKSLDGLLALHKSGKLLAHIIELEKTNSTDVGKLKPKK